MVSKSGLEGRLDNHCWPGDWWGMGDDCSCGLCLVSSFILAADTNVEWPGQVVAMTVVWWACRRCFFLDDDGCELTVNQFYTKHFFTFSKLFCHSQPSLRNWPEAGFWWWGDFSMLCCQMQLKWCGQKNNPELLRMLFYFFHDWICSAQRLWSLDTCLSIMLRQLKPKLMKGFDWFLSPNEWSHRDQNLSQSRSTETLILLSASEWNECTTFRKKERH